MENCLTQTAKIMTSVHRTAAPGSALLIRHVYFMLQVTPRLIEEATARLLPYFFLFVLCGNHRSRLSSLCYILEKGCFVSQRGRDPLVNQRMLWPTIPSSGPLSCVYVKSRKSCESHNHTLHFTTPCSYSTVLSYDVRVPPDPAHYSRGD